MFRNLSRGHSSYTHRCTHTKVSEIKSYHLQHEGLLNGTDGRTDTREKISELRHKE